jgi:hypothetical protein
MNPPTPTTVPFPSAIPPELEADTRAVLEKLATGKPLDPAVREHIRRDAARVCVDLCPDSIVRRRSCGPVGGRVPLARCQVAEAVSA